MSTISSFMRAQDPGRAAAATKPHHHGQQGRSAAAGAALCLLMAASGPSVAAANGALHARASAPPAAAATSRSPAAAKAELAGSEVWRDNRLDALTDNFWRWLMSIPPGVSPTDDTSGVNCGINQRGRIWFLGGPIGSEFSATCEIPAGRAIVVPVFTFINDFPCPDPNFKPPPGQSLEQFLQLGVAPYIDGVSLAEALLDGNPLPVRRISTKLFPFTGAAGLTAFDPCVTGSPQVGVSDGHWTFIDPPPRGDHVLVLRSVSDFGTSQGTYTLKIR